MNKEAIERTKARCKKEIRDKDRIYVLPGFYVKKQKEDQESESRAYDYTTGKEMDSYLQDEPVQMPNTLVPETGREALIAITLTSIMWALFTWLVLI